MLRMQDGYGGQDLHFHILMFSKVLGKASLYQPSLEELRISQWLEDV